MTATELYAVDPEFRQFIQCWIADKRCPYALADCLMDHGCESQANAAHWAATEPDRCYDMLGKRMCGPYPMQTNELVNRHLSSQHGMDYPRDKWIWLGRRYLNNPWHYPGIGDLVADTEIDAILMLLDSCREKTFKPLESMNFRGTGGRF